MTTTYALTIDQDYDPEPPDTHTWGRVVSFNTRHTNFEHPDTYLRRDCPTCDGSGIVGGDGDNPNYSDDCPTCYGYGEVSTSLQDHPDVLAVLSYYEHGLCKWMVGPSTVPDYGSFDTANVAGVLVYNGDDEERPTWDDFTDERRARIMDTIVQDYTEWCNGNVYAYQLEEYPKCPTCHQDVTEDGEYVEGCAGFIGRDALLEGIADTFLQLDLDPSRVSIRGPFGYEVDVADIRRAMDAQRVTRKVTS